jgi:hypothetical protein
MKERCGRSITVLRTPILGMARKTFIDLHDWCRSEEAFQHAEIEV